MNNMQEVKRCKEVPITNTSDVSEYRNKEVKCFEVISDKIGRYIGKNWQASEISVPQIPEKQSKLSILS